MRFNYKPLDKLPMLMGDIYQVSYFILWYLSLPFYLIYDFFFVLFEIVTYIIKIWFRLSLYLVLALLKSKLLNQFIQSSFACILVCSVLFTILIFASWSSLPLILTVILKSLLLFSLLIFSLNGLKSLDLKYKQYENDQESKMLHDIRRQSNLGVPDKSDPHKGDTIDNDSIERLALQLRLAELEARQNTLRVEAEYKQQELELKRQQLAIDKATVESPLYQLKKDVEARKVLVSDLETKQKEEDLGLRDRDRDKDLTQNEKERLGIPTNKQVSMEVVKLVRSLEKILKESGYQAEIFKLTANKLQYNVIFSVNANNPMLPDGDDFIESIMLAVDSSSVKIRPMNKAIEFQVMKRKYIPKDPQEK